MTHTKTIDLFRASHLPNARSRNSRETAYSRSNSPNPTCIFFVASLSQSCYRTAQGNSLPNSMMRWDTGIEPRCSRD